MVETLGPLTATHSDYTTLQIANRLAEARAGPEAGAVANGAAVKLAGKAAEGSQPPERKRLKDATSVNIAIGQSHHVTYHGIKQDPS